MNEYAANKHVPLRVCILDASFAESCERSDDCSTVLAGAGYKAELVSYGSEPDWEKLNSADTLIIHVEPCGVDWSSVFKELDSRSLTADIILLMAMPASEAQTLLSSVASLNLNVTAIIKKPVNPLDLLAETERSVQCSSLFTFSQYSMDLFCEAIETGSFVFEYRPFYSLENGQLVRLDVEPCLVDVTGAIDEKDFRLLLRDQEVAIRYFNYVIDKVTSEAELINQFGSNTYVLKIPAVLLEDPALRKQTVARLVAGRSMNTQFMVAIDDSDYFNSLDVLGNGILELKQAGFAILLDVAHSSLFDVTFEKLGVFDHIVLGSANENAALPRIVGGKLNRGNLQARLKKLGIGLGMRNKGGQLKTLELIMSGFAYCDRFETTTAWSDVSEVH